MSRRRPKVAAAIVAPVEPQLTIASAASSATSRAASTTEASGLARTAGTGSSSLPIHSAVATTSTPSTPSRPSSAGGPEDADADPVGGGEARALGEHVETLLSAVPVEGNGDAAPRRHGYWESEGVAGVSATLCEMTSRPA